MSEFLVTTIYRNSDNLLSEVKVLLDKGADPSEICLSKETNLWGKSPLQAASEIGRLDVIKLLLSRGANASQLGWTNIFYAIAYGSTSNLKKLITAGSDLEHRDSCYRTPLLFSILIGDINKTSMLIEAGADVKATDDLKTPFYYAILKDDVNMLNWLIEHGFDPELTNAPYSNAYGNPLIEASQHGAIKCLKAMIEKGGDPLAKNERLLSEAMENACNLEITIALVNAGASSYVDNMEMRTKMLGYRLDEKPNISKDDYIKGAYAMRGKSNPEPASKPFWLALIKSGELSYGYSHTFDKECDKIMFPPRWNYVRFGRSITLLPDGRIIEIAGEHEDYYDSDFYIYNDVFVHDGKGNCDIYIYPSEIFTPTDFHTATLVDKYIYIIGNLGYVEDRKVGYTQVFRLNINTLRIEKIETTGEMPGWISRHRATYDGKSSITIMGGELFLKKDEKFKYMDNQDIYSLNLKLMKWSKLKNPKDVHVK